jgi:hypothetical protein|tara:strand:+ start:2048 stop:2473 length:426 start_codon:yes stop_codon:yes gene_type:complete
MDGLQIILIIVLVLIAARVALGILSLVLIGAFNILGGVAPRDDESMTPVLLLVILWVIAFPLMFVLSLIVGFIHYKSNMVGETKLSIVEEVKFYFGKNQESETLLPPYKKPAGFYGTRALLGSILIVLGASLIIYLIDYLF